MCTVDEVKNAFDNSFSVCVDFHNKANRLVKVRLFNEMLHINPDMIINDVDCCFINNNPIIKRKQTIIINRNGSKEHSNQLVELLEKCNLTSEIYKIFSEKKYGVKGCCRLEKDMPSVIMIANLLEDDGQYLLTIRNGLHKKKLNADIKEKNG